MDTNSDKNSRENIFQKTTKLPDFVQEAMSDSENAKINAEIRDKYKLDEDQFSALLYILVRVYVQDIYLQNFPKVLKEELKIKDDALVKKIALEIAQRRFFPLKEHLIGIERLIKDLGGEIPKIIPKPKPVSTLQKPPVKRYSIFPEKPEIIKKDIKTALKENKKIEAQLIGTKPIRTLDYEVPVKPTIKNWLADYDQKLGAGYHSNIERVNYLYQSENAKSLLPYERENLGFILKSYDENSLLSISAKTGLIVFPFKAPLESPPKIQKEPEKIKEPKPASPKEKTEKKKTTPESKKEQPDAAGQNKPKTEYKNIKAAPERKVRTMKKDIKEIFKK